MSDTGTARAMLLVSEMEFHEPVTKGRDEQWCCGKRAQQWVCIHPCLCGRQAPNYMNDTTLHVTSAPLDADRQEQLPYTRIAACVDIGEGCGTRKLPQKLKVKAAELGQRQKLRLTAYKIPGV
jgi:hypothetical protein